MSDVHARILLWGIEGAGKTTTIEMIHARLRADLRGKLRRESTRLDPTIQYETLPITLGEVAGVATKIEVIAVPGSPDQAMTRKQLLDEVDGIVIVVDCSPERIDANYAAIDELKSALASYGHRIEAFPIVLQYNKRDVADPFAIEELHRQLGFQQAAVFETIATKGDGILPTLTTISKHVVRSRRASDSAKPAKDLDPSTSSTADAVEGGAQSTHEILEAAILAVEDDVEAGEILDFDQIDATQPNWEAISDDGAKSEAGLGAKFHIVSAGEAKVTGDGNLRLQLILGDEAGQTRSVVLSLRLDTLARDGED